MSIELIIYGNLKNKVNSEKTSSTSPAKLKLIKNDSLTTVKDILRKIGLKNSQISHIFVNSKYCGPGKELEDKDRVGIFPKNMGLIFAEIEKNNPIIVSIKLGKGVKTNVKNSEIMMRLPEGSNIDYLLKKLDLKSKKEELEISLNDKKILDSHQTILCEGDSIHINVEA